MKILVCISHVPDTTSKINFTNDNTTFDANGIQFVINPNDEFGLTRAMQIKEATGSSITVINVGDASTEPTLRKALAIGADDAIRVDCNPTDSFMVAKEIAEVVNEIGFDLIIAGKESIDYNGGAVPGMLSALINRPCINACIGLEIDGESVTAIREIDGGKETLTCNLPVIIAGQKGLVNESDLRIPNMRGIMTARTKPLNVRPASGADHKVQTITFEKPAPKSAVKLVDPENVAELVNLLHTEAKVI